MSIILVLSLLQAAPAQSQYVVPDDRKPTDLVAIVIDSTRSGDERREAMHRLLRVSRRERVHALSEVAGATSDSYRYEAVVQLVRLGNNEANQAIREAFTVLPALEQQSILQEDQMNPDSGLTRDLPYHLLTRLIANNGTLGTNGCGAKALDVAAQMLSGNADRTDFELIAAALLACPTSRGLWLARSTGGPLNESEPAKARAIRDDPSRDHLLRVAAAVAMAPVDAESVRFATGRIQSFLAQYASVPVAKMVEDMQSHERWRQGYLSYETTLTVVGMLRYLKSPEAERLTFEFLDSPNEHVRQILGLVAVKRWPDRFLSSPVHFSEREYPFLLKALAMYNQQFKDDATRRLRAVQGEEVGVDSPIRDLPFSFSREATAVVTGW